MKGACELIHSLNSKAKWPLSRNEGILLQAVLVSGLITFREIRNHFLSGVDPSNAHRSVRRLVKRRFIEPVMIKSGEAYGWRLAPEVQEQFTKRMGYRGLGRYRVYPTIESHNEKVRAFARALDSAVETDWIAHEPSIRAHQMTVSPMRGHALEISVPDLIAQIHTPDGPKRIAFEMELTLKSTSRLDQILDNRISADQWDKVVYLLGNGLPVQKFLERASRIIKTSSKVLANKRTNQILFANSTAVEKTGFDAKCFTPTGETSLYEFLK